MNKTYVIISVSDYKDLNSSTRTVNCGEAAAPAAGTVAVTPMITYTFVVPNPSASDISNYDVGKYVSLTVAPTSAPAGASGATGPSGSTGPTGASS